LRWSEIKDVDGTTDAGRTRADTTLPVADCWPSVTEHSALPVRFDLAAPARLKRGEYPAVSAANVSVRSVVRPEARQVAGGSASVPDPGPEAALRATQLLQPGSLGRGDDLPGAATGHAAGDSHRKPGCRLCEKRVPEAGWEIRTRDNRLAATRGAPSELYQFSTWSALPASVGGGGVANAVKSHYAIAPRRHRHVQGVGRHRRDVLRSTATQVIALQ